jgi:polyvinyl alcohol dehydrogenase (cytochrome)
MRVLRRPGITLLIVVLLSAILVAAAAGPAAAQGAPDGGQIYKQRCASCHDGGMPRVPGREALRGRTPEDIELALSSFAMRRQGEALRPAERRAVAEFLTGAPAGSYRAPLDIIPKRAYCDSSRRASTDPLAGPEWNGWGAGPRNMRFQVSSTAGLNAADVLKLKVKWAFGFPGASASGSQVTVAGSRVFVGSRNGILYALDAQTGCIAWAFEAAAGIRSTPVLGRVSAGEVAVFFGDAYANVYALDAATGSERWKVKVEAHPDAMITGGIAFRDGRLYVPVSSLEEATGAMPTYECCTFRGSVVALDASAGRQLWKTHTIAQAAQPTTTNSVGTQLWGPSGAAIWSAPTVDPERNRLFVTTGDSYSNPPAAASDAVMALALDSGRILWTKQTLAGDAWNTGCFAQGEGRVNCPASPGPDFDFGSSSILTTLPGGRLVLLAGQKSGMLHALNPDTGEVLWQRQVGDGGVLGGIEWGFASDGSTAYVSLSNALEKKPGEAGGVAAVDVATGSIRWKAPPQNACAGRARCNSGQPAAVTAIPGAVFSGSLDGHLRAYDSATGKVIWDVDTAREFETVNGVAARGGSLNGPGAVVAGGMLYVSSGYSSLGFMPGNVLLAFSVDGR